MTAHTLARLLLAGSVVPIAAPAAHAQTVCDRNVGPDVIVGSLHRNGNDTSAGPGTTNWSATVSGVPMCAFSFGTTSCNVGDFNLSWNANTNQHPVIGQNLFRLKTITTPGGSYQTFDQLGQSWLKHGFCSLRDTECCSSCVFVPGCHSFLSPSCSDPYTASRNAQQSSLGPKWQINANTGVFPYPHAQGDGAATANTVKRRLQVRAADLDTTSAFFIEGQYVAQDDAAAGNQNNNASYRPVHFVGGPTSYTMWLDGTTVREKSAIQAWKASDPGVTQATFQVPGEGKLIISSKATAIGGGMWHYEYAVYNMNSDLGVGRFSVPVPASAVIQNVQFRDVDYAGGDGIGNVSISGADWTTAHSGGNYAWSTVPFSTNPNGNAIRWGTMYSFRFDCNVAPAQSGSATIGMWKNPSLNYQVAAQIPGAGQSLTNNACATPTVIGAGNLSFNTAGATTDGPGACGIANDVWYRFSTNCTGTVFIQVATGDFLPGVAVYQGWACPPTASVACNTTGSGQISFTSAPQTVYTIRLGSIDGGAGVGTLSLSVPTAPNISQQPAAQTTCAGGQASFSITAGGVGPLSYQWKRNGNNIPNATSNSYTIQNVQPGHAGSYTCAVTNPCTTITSSPAALTVNTPALITQQPPASLAPAPGAQASLSVTATGTNLSYQWRRNGQPISNGGGTSGAATPTLTINPFNPAAHSGRYSVIVTNPCGSVTSSEAILCYANCDLSTVSPILNVADFTCYLQRFGSADPFANCDGSTTPPTLNVADFTCFLQRFAQNCP